MTKNHTPGPWNRVCHSWSDESVYSADGKQICTHSIKDKATEANQDQLEAEMSANMTLIAAAPDLLEATKDIVRLLQSSVPLPVSSLQGVAIDIALSAIEKAEGRV